MEGPVHYQNTLDRTPYCAILLDAGMPALDRAPGVRGRGEWDNQENCAIVTYALGERARTRVKFIFPTRMATQENVNAVALLLGDAFECATVPGRHSFVLGQITLTSISDLQEFTDIAWTPAMANELTEIYFPHRIRREWGANGLAANIRPAWDVDAEVPMLIQLAEPVAGDERPKKRRKESVKEHHQQLYQSARAIAPDYTPADSGAACVACFRDWDEPDEETGALIKPVRLSCGHAEMCEECTRNWWSKKRKRPTCDICKTSVLSANTTACVWEGCADAATVQCLPCAHTSLCKTHAYSAIEDAKKGGRVFRCALCSGRVRGVLNATFE